MQHFAAILYSTIIRRFSVLCSLSLLLLPFFYQAQELSPPTEVSNLETTTIQEVEIYITGDVEIVGLEATNITKATKYPEKTSTKTPTEFSIKKAEDNAIAQSKPAKKIIAKEKTNHLITSSKSSNNFSLQNSNKNKTITSRENFKIGGYKIYSEREIAQHNFIYRLPFSFDASLTKSTPILSSFGVRPPPTFC